MSGWCPNYDDLKQLSKELRRPVSTLIALSPGNDPFYAALPSNRAGAEWFAELWQRYGTGRARHLRRVHYVVQAQPHGSVLMPDGAPYENTEACWAPLAQASKHARYLGLVDPDALIDRRNPEPMLFHEHPGEPSEASVWAGEGSTIMMKAPEFPEFPCPPRLYLTAPARKRPVVVEVWVEKAGDLDDVLVPLCRRRKVNLIPCKGEQGIQACRKVAERAASARCPVRILYLSDFDPGGDSMPVAVARKVEFELRDRGLELDIQVRPIGLTHDQCIAYKLPRTPIKDTERRAARFEERFGEGATELDALEALHPGVLGRIVDAEIARYQTIDLETVRRFAEVSRQVRTALQAVEQTVLARHADLLDELSDEHERLQDAHSQVLDELAELERRIEAAHRDIRDELREKRPDLTRWSWPEPDGPDEDPDPLFDSRRGYVEQIDRYKAHQGKPTRRKANGKGEP